MDETLLPVRASYAAVGASWNASASAAATRAIKRRRELTLSTNAAMIPKALHALHILARWE